MAWCLIKHRQNINIFIFLLRRWRAGLVQSEYRLGYGLDDLGSIPGRGNDGVLSLRHRVQIGYGAHSASYSMGTAAIIRGEGR
jgi:hypothetical protein